MKGIQQTIFTERERKGNFFLSSRLLPPSRLACNNNNDSFLSFHCEEAITKRRRRRRKKGKATAGEKERERGEIAVGKKRRRRRRRKWRCAVDRAEQTDIDVTVDSRGQKR